MVCRGEGASLLIDFSGVSVHLSMCVFVCVCACVCVCVCVWLQCLLSCMVMFVADHQWTWHCHNDHRVSNGRPTAWFGLVNTLKFINARKGLKKQPLASRMWPRPTYELWQMLIKVCSVSMPAVILVFIRALPLSLPPLQVHSMAQDSWGEMGHLCINLGYFIDPVVAWERGASFFASHPPTHTPMYEPSIYLLITFHCLGQSISAFTTNKLFRWNLSCGLREPWLMWND